MTEHNAESAPLHRIEVERDDEGPTSVRFICEGDDAALCHHWPDCDCETWGGDHGDPWAPKGHPDREPKPGHQNVQQPSCWIDPWFNDALSDPGDWIDAHDGEDELAFDDLVSGYIETTFEGEYMTWDYAPGLSTPPGETHDRLCNLAASGIEPCDCNLSTPPGKPVAGGDQ